MDRQYNIVTQIYVLTQRVPRIENCMGFMFTNTGDVTAYVNDMVIYPNSSANALGDSRTIMAHEGVVCVGNIDLKFEFGSPGVNPRVELVQMGYIN